jgi:hypothetical protein
VPCEPISRLLNGVSYLEAILDTCGERVLRILRYAVLKVSRLTKEECDEVYGYCCLGCG